RPYFSIAPYSGDGPLEALAERAARMNVTCLLGNATRLAKLTQFLSEITGHATLIDTWPDLQAVLYSRGRADPQRTELTSLVGSKPGRTPLLIEACVRPEGVLAVEDPRFGRLRMLADHGVFFEFVPIDELGRAHTLRLGLGEIQAGVSYAVAVT